MITVAGLTPSLDLTYGVDALRLGEIHRVGDVVRCAGGKGLNLARAATTMGADCAAVAILGGPTGQALTSMLAAEGLAGTSVGSPAETRVCVSIAAADSGQLTEVYQEAAAVPDEVWGVFRAELETALHARPGWLAVSGRAPVGRDDLIAEVVALGRQSERPVALDSSSAALGPALAAGPSLLKINRYEAAAELGVAAGTDLLAMARALRTRGPATVILTDGVDGALAVDGSEAVQAGIVGEPGRYPVGSGDSFLGGLLAALDAGDGLADALRTATACGVANALAPGQGHFDRATAARLAAQVELRRVS